MRPIRENKKKKKLEKIDAEHKRNTLVYGFSEEKSDEWRDLSAKIYTENPSSSLVTSNFKDTFRMSRTTFDYICSLVRKHMMAKSRFSFTNGKPMSLNDQVALALRRLGSGNPLMSIGNSFGTHHSIVSQVTWRFVEAIEENGLHHIQWPSTVEEKKKIKCKFEGGLGRIPYCCGAIDTTHIKMRMAPSDSEADAWLDQEKNYTMMLQAIVDPDLRFLDIVTGYPGKMSDSSVLQSSNFFKLCQNNEKLETCKITFSSKETELREYIVGDSGYPLLPWLMTPYQGEECSKKKVELNKRLITTHSVAKRALAKLKDDWKIIQGKTWIPNKNKLPSLILVCCILHNIVIDLEGDKDHDNDPFLDHDLGYPPEVCESVDKAGSILRDRLSKCISGI